MKRKTKNLIMITLLIILLGAMAFTIYQSSSKNNSINPMINQNDGQPPEMPNGSEGSNNQMENIPEKPSDEKNNMEEPPAKPDGEDNNAPNGQIGNPPEMPNGNNNGQVPSMNNSNSNKLSIVYYIIFGIEGLAISIIILYLILSKFNEKTFKETFEKKDKIIILILSTIILTSGIIYIDKVISESLNSNNQLANEPTDKSQNISYSGKTEITDNKTISSGDYSSNTANENAILLSGNIDVTISNINVDKTGDSDGGDNTSFYGMNSGILAKSGATLTIKNTTINTNATGGNGIFSYGGSATTNNSNSDGTTINISDSKITTEKDNSGGIMVTGGGILNATNLNITTAGTSSAAIRSDRGGGTLNVDGGTYKTTGQGSPSIYSTATITVKNANLIAESSEGVIIEGKNSITLENVTLTDTNNKLNGESTTYKNIFIYQSMSGDASVGTATFKATDSKITTNKGDTIYVTNTKTTIYLKNNTFVNNDKNGNFLRVKKDSWGNNGSNGGDVTLTMENQKAEGNIVIDSISTLDMTMKSSSYYEGTINGDNTAKSIKLILDKSSKIKLTGDTYITSLQNEDINNSNIEFNGYKLYVNGKSIN